MRNLKGLLTLKGYGFCSQPSMDRYRPFLSPHIYSALSKSFSKYKICPQYFNLIINSNSNSPQQAKIKCTMIFNALCTNDSLTHLKPLVCRLIVQDKLKSQYELDQLIKWLIKETKKNSQLGQKEIDNLLAAKQTEIDQFQNQLKQMDGSKLNEKCFSDICKWFRNKFRFVDSQTIYSKVKNYCDKNPGNFTTIKKDNKFWDKLQTIKPRHLKQQCNTKQTYKNHQQITQQKLRFRFPPQPNGYLHIGHLKSIRINFETAKRVDGVCYLRFDDTNPQKQSHEFIKQIQDNVRWLGYTPDKITFASDYFGEMIELAHRLVKDGHAYVCDSSQQEIQIQRKNRQFNPYRSLRSIEDNLKIFPNLEPNQTLRLKGDPTSSNPTLRDPVIYRFKSSPHPKTGNKYKIYPIYDFAHSTGDSLEHIDYSLCSLQFEVRRELYYRYLHLLQIYKPTVWEYSRLNIQNNVLSKRKIKALIDEGLVQSWEDPRLLTVRGLQKRGYTPDMLKGFIDLVNSSRAGNENVVQHSLLEKEMKKQALKNSIRVMAILDPVQIIAESQGNKQKMYLEAVDVKLLGSSQFIILHNMGLFEVMKNIDSEVYLKAFTQKSIKQAKKDNPNLKNVNWVKTSESINLEISIFGPLLQKNGQFNPQSKKIYENAKAQRVLIEEDNAYWQLEKLGIFKWKDQLKKQMILCTKL